MSKRNVGKLIGVNSIDKIADKIKVALLDGRVREILKQETQVIVNNAKANSLSVSSSVSNSIQHIERGNYPLHVLIAPKYPEGNLAHLFEYGTKPRYTKDGSYRGQIIATPFMRPAIDSNIKQVEKKIGARIKTEVQKLKK